MRAIPNILLTTIVLTASAHEAAFSAPAMLPASAATSAAQVDAPLGLALTAPISRDPTGAAVDDPKANAGFATEGQSQADRDVEAIYGPELVRDPWEAFNRKMHSFNNTADKFVLRPLAVGYKRITPDPVQAGVSRSFANLVMPATVVNQALQGRPSEAAKSLGRLVVNTTIGIVSVFDPAYHIGLTKRDNEDFAQTLATWGWRDSRYLVLPLLGPRTVRDAFGIVGDQPLSPLAQIQDGGTAIRLQVLEMVDGRMRLLPLDEFRRDALDDYVFVRDAWVQRRNHQIQHDLRSIHD